MRRILVIFVVLVAAMGMTARAEKLDSLTMELCEQFALVNEVPAHYCDCHINSTEMPFPAQTAVSDSAWYTCKGFKDILKNGMTAYWFADCKITMDVYVSCIFEQPAVHMTIGPNSMREIDPEEIKQKTGDMSESVSELVNALAPHMHVCPHKGGSGRAYLYPYDKGPHSTCEDPLPFFPELAYVADQTENVYRLAWADIPEDGEMYLRWVQKKEKAAEVWWTAGECDSQTMGQINLTDSMHVYRPNVEKMQSARENQQDVWIHIRHANKVTGRLFWTKEKYDIVEEDNAVETVTTEPKRATKRLENNQLVIIIDDKKCNVLGQQI
jgi:hypothetical protein